MNNLNLNLLKYFYEVVKEKNITRASETLLVSQPAVTRAIKELEDELNVKLLIRNKKGVVPTNEGLILYEHTKEMFKDISSTLNIIDKSKTENQHLYIGTTTTNFTIFIMDTLRKFKIQNPKVQIHIVLEEMHILNEMASLGKLDILIKNNYESINDFENIKNFKIEDKFIASPKFFPELKEKTYSLKELLNYPFVLLSDITHGRRNFDAYLNSLNIKLKPAYEFNSYSLCRELIKNGFGIGIGNPIHYIDRQDYLIIKTDFELPSRTFNIGYLKTSQNNLIKKFIEIFEED